MEDNDYVGERAYVEQDQIWFDRAVERLRHDLSVTTDLRPGFEVDLSEYPRTVYRYSHDSDPGGSHGAWLRPPESAADAVVVVANPFVEDVFYEVWTAWPVCPGHAHPAEARLVGDDAAWTCPKSGTMIVSVGALAAPERPLRRPRDRRDDWWMYPTSTRFRDGQARGPVEGEVLSWMDEEAWGVLASAEVEGEVWVLYPMIVLDDPHAYRSLHAGQRVRFTYETTGQDGYPHRAVQVWPL